MPRTSTPFCLPDSYASLEFSHISVTHVPATSKAPSAVLLIKLDRPDKNNAFTENMQKSLEAIYRLIDLDDRVKAVVLTGAGRMFCPGADLEIGFSGGAAKGEGGSVAKTARNIDHRDG